ncbi:MAG TPA: type VII secretion target [Pseudonocardiaceae bacterium]|nr:type VII secretion target [Pseudonocardiaceae bacterium]
MQDSFEVYPEDLRAHARALDRYARRIGTTRSAADSASLGIESFGILCQFFALDAHGHADTAKCTLDSLRDAVGHLAGGVRDTAELYDRVDQANRVIFEGVR